MKLSNINTFSIPNGPLHTCLMLALSLALNAGCGGKSIDVSQRPKFEGTVQEDLDPEKKEKQLVISRFFKAMQEGVTTRGELKFFLPDVELTDPPSLLLDGGVRLFSWDFNGTPKGDEVPVVVVIDDKESGRIDPASERRQERVYLVTRVGDSFMVSLRK